MPETLRSHTDVGGNPDCRRGQSSRTSHTPTRTPVPTNRVTPSPTKKSTPTPTKTPTATPTPKPQEFAYATDSQGVNFSAYRINLTTGALAQLSGSPFRDLNDDPVQAVASANGKFLFVADAFLPDVEAYTINAINGAITSVPGSPFPCDPPASFASCSNVSLALDHTGKFFTRRIISIGTSSLTS